jgi:hypothetical protein
VDELDAIAVTGVVDEVGEAIELEDGDTLLDDSLSTGETRTLLAADEVVEASLTTLTLYEVDEGWLLELEGEADITASPKMSFCAPFFQPHASL